MPAEEMLPLNENDPAFAALHKEMRERAAELGERAGCPRRSCTRCSTRSTEPGQVRRPRRRLHRAARRREAGAARDAQRRGAAAPRARARAAADRHARGAGGDQVAGAGRARRAAARDVPARADEGDPEGARRRRPDARRSRELREKLDEARAAQGGAQPKSSASSAASSAPGRESMEAQVIRTYLEWIAELPWNTRSDDQLDLNARREGARRGSLRPRGREGSRARVPGRAPAARAADRRGGRRRRGEVPAAKLEPKKDDATPSLQQPTDEDRHDHRRDGGEGPRDGEGPDPALRRPAGRRQDVDRQVDRARARPRVRARRARRRARRGGHPRPPPHVRRRDARPHHPGHEAGGHARTRSSCSTRSTSSARRSRAIRRARCSRCSTRRRTTRSPITTWRAVRPERGAVHRDGELHPEHSRAAARPHGGRRLRRLHRAREGARSPRST